MLQPPPQARTTLDRFRAEPERRIGWQYAVGLLFFLVASLGGSLIGVVLNVVVYGSLDAQTLNEPWPGTTVALLIEGALSVLGFWLLMRWLAGRPAVELGRPWASELLAGLGIGVGLMSISVGLVAALGGYRVSGAQFGIGIVTGLAIGIGAGFAEEIFFRGVLVRLLDKQLGAGPAIAITSILFGGIHFTNPEATIWGGFAIMVEAGVLLGAAYLLTRRLWLAIGIHIGWNFAQSGLFSINVSGSGLGAGGLLRSEMDGPAWLTGGSMGIEGSVISVLVGLAGGIVLLVLARRRGNLRPRVRRSAPPLTADPI